MATRFWIRRLFDRKPSTVRKAPSPVSGRDRGFRPRLEGLEDRTLPTLTLSAFAPPLIDAGYAGVIFPDAIAVGDLTGNGLPNVVDVDSANFEFGSTPPPNAGVDVFSDRPGVGFSYVPSYFAAAGNGSDAFVGTDVALGDFDGRHYANGKPILDMAVAIQDQIGALWVSILKNTSTTDSLGNTTLSFGSPTIYNTWGTDVTVGDFNGDGRDDVLTTGAGGTPHLLMNNGDGTFQRSKDLGGDVSGKAVVGDFDGRHYANGLPILDVAEIGGKGIDVLMNNGNGTFKPPVSYGAEVLTQYQLDHNAVAVGDFNADGKVDLAVANAGDNNVNVLMGNGDGTFQPAVNYAVGPTPMSVGVGDFNGDGKLDIAVANDNGNASSVSVLQGTGKGTFLKAQNFADIPAGNDPLVPGQPTIGSSGGLNYSALAVGDFAGNGCSGVAVLSAADLSTGTSAAIYVMQGAGQSFFQPPVQLPGASAAVAGDFNGDGKTDVAFNNANGIQLFLGNGDGAFSNPIDTSVGRGKVVTLAPGDFNGDGNLGLLAIRGGLFDLYAFPANGDGTFNPFLLVDSGFNHDASSAAAGDFTGNGKVDIAVISYGRLNIYMQNSDGTFGSGTLTNGYLPTRSYQLSGTWGSIAVGDFNGDGKLDLVVGGVGVLLGNGDGTFQSPVSYGGGTHVAVSDLDGRHYANGQPILDLVTTVDDGVNVSLGNGDGTFQNPVFYRLTIPPNNSTYSGAQPLAVGEFNGDGNLDIAVGCVGGTVSVLLGNGDGTFQGPYCDQVSDSSHIAAGDFTGDGRSAIVTASGQILSSSPDFSLSNASVAEQQPAGTLVGSFNTPNADPNNFFTYTFVGGSGGDDNADFTIDAQGNLHTAAGFDYATKSSYSIRVRSTDIVGQISEGVFTINVLPLAATVSVTPYDLSYDGNTHTATGTATGIGGVDLSADLVLAGTTHTDAGTYSDSWIFHDPTGVYQDASGTVSDSISPANAYASVAGYNISYDGNAHTAVASAIDINGNPLPTSDFDLTATVHTNAGTYTDAWTFHDPSGNYQDASGTVSDSISQANAGAQVTGYSILYDGNAHFAVASATDVNGNLLPTSDFDLTATVHTNAGTYTDAWTFHDPSGNYQDASGTVSDAIGQDAPTVKVSDAGGMYSGSAFPATATVAGVVTGVDNTAASTLEGVGLTLDYVWLNSNGTTTDLGRSAPTLPGNYTVTALFADSTDYTKASATTSFTIGQPMSAITPLVTSPTGQAVGVPGQPLTDKFAVNAPTQGIVFTINYGDGTSVTTSAVGTSVKLDHIYKAPGTFIIQVKATNQNGFVIQLATEAVRISTVAMEADPSGGTALAVGGSAAGGQTIIVSATNTAGTALNVNINGKSLGTFTPTGHVFVYAQGGKNKITLQPFVQSGIKHYIEVPAFLYGEGPGGDHISAAGSAANNVLSGQGKSEVLTGGQGRDLLIGGAGAATLNAGVGDDILIGGCTNYDLGSTGMTYDHKLGALEAIMAEWGSTDSYATRLSDLGSLLNTNTVHDNIANGVDIVDQLHGNASANDWFFAGLNDPITGKNGNDKTVTIK